MNKILIVGHPQSGHEEVEELLQACGMASAQPSRREGYLPQQISATLCKAHNAGTLQRIESGSAEVQQIEAGPVWHGMALDLMLGNLEQPFWGWSDPQSIFLLEYWRNLDPAITFVLVYDKPQSVLTRLDASTAARLDPQALQHRAQGWTAYNAALLHFFLRHPERCLLVNAEQVRTSAASYLQQMRARIDAPWSDRMDQLAGPLALTDASDTAPTQTQPAEAGAPALPAPEHTPITPLRPAPDALTTYLADALLNQHPASLQLYEELQACANLPLADDISHATPAALQAWQSMAAHQLELQAQAQHIGTLEQASQALQHQLDEAESLARQKQTLVDQLSAARQHAEQLAQQRQQLLDEQTRLRASDSHNHQQQLAELATARDLLAARQREATEENDLLLNQLHQVQEELERHYLATQQQAQRLEALQKTEASLRQTTDEQQQRLAQQQAQLAQLQTREQDAQKRLQALQTELRQAQANLEARQREAGEENELLLTQLHQVQEELERQFLDAQQKAQRLETLQKAEASLRQSSAQQQKQLEEQQREVRQQQERLTALQTQLKAKEQEAQQKVQALQTELQNTKAQASEPPAELLQENELLLNQLHQVQEELERYYLLGQEQSQKLLDLQQQQQRVEQLQAELAALKAAPPQPSLFNQELLEQLLRSQEDQERQFHAAKQRPVPGTGGSSFAFTGLGAADRVRQQLSYRLGTTMIERSHSVGGWLGMPFALIGVARQHKRERAQREAQHLPPIEKYRDAQEAERVRQHLSYRLGQVLLRNVRSPVGWVRLPWALRREVRNFRRQRQQQG